MVKVDCKKDGKWLVQILEGMKYSGYGIVENVLEPSFIELTRSELYSVREKILGDVGEERLRKAGELGVLRLMMKCNSHFIRLLEVPELLALIDHTVSDTAILHLQNGFILPSFPKAEMPMVFQNRFHRDFPRVLNGYLASVNAFFAIDEFTRENGGTLIVPGTHQRESAPSLDFLESNAIPIECPAGSMIVFDSTLWHAAGANLSGKDRLGINHQFTRSFFKQQIDYVRVLGDGAVKSQLPRTQQLLGWYTRVPTSLDDYYKTPEERLYRAGQG